MKNKFKNFDILLFFTFLYLFLPVAIFFITWVKLAYAIIVFLPLIFFFLKNYKDVFFKEGNMNLLNKKNMGLLIICLTIIYLWLFYSGVGGFSFQNIDYNKHNALLHDLININWPVHYNDGSLCGGDLVYYFAYYLPSSLIGKLFGFSVANVSLFIWTYIGIVIGLFWIFRLTGKISVVPLVLLILFGGFDFLGGIVFRKTIPPFAEHIEWYYEIIQYSSLTTLLYWTPHMFVPTLIVVPFLLYSINNLDKFNIILFLFMACLLLWAPFVLIGLLPLFCYYIYKCIRKIDKKFFSITFFISCIIISLLLILFIFSNNDSAQIKGFIWQFSDDDIKKTLLKLAIFCLLEFGLVFIFIMFFKKKGYNYTPLYISIIFLSLIPFIYVGKNNDFAMRVSIPLLITLYIYFSMTVMDICKKIKNNKNDKVKLIIMFLLIVAISYSSVNEIITGAIIYPSSLTDNWKTIVSKKNKLKNQYISKNCDNVFTRYIKK